jgi:hypothetical protein
VDSLKKKMIDELTGTMADFAREELQILEEMDREFR